MNYVWQTVFSIVVVDAIVDDATTTMTTTAAAATLAPAVNVAVVVLVLVVCPLALLCGNKLALKISNQMQRKSKKLHASDFNLLVLCSIHLRNKENLH